MGNELLIEEESDSRQRTHTEIFSEWCPYYLSIGMTSAEYWEGDCLLTQYYRKAYLMKQSRENEKAWLQGLYIYDAVSTVVKNGWGLKSNEQPTSYPAKPYAITEEEKKAEQELKVLEAQAQAQVWMNFLCTAYSNIKDSAIVPETEVNSNGNIG